MGEQGGCKQGDNVTVRHALDFPPLQDPHLGSPTRNLSRSLHTHLKHSMARKSSAKAGNSKGKGKGKGKGKEIGDAEPISTEVLQVSMGHTAKLGPIN